jgi:putative SOS response-associated peptidase YedK
MCGRFTNEMTWSEIHALYSILDKGPPPSNMPPRYNIAPTQSVHFAHKDSDGHLMVDYGRWWLVPFFAKELPKAAMFNARIETVDTSGAFREPFKSKRCLIPADGYFEWTTSAEDGKKDPWLFQMPEAKGFSFAGIWAHNDKLDVTSCTIITAPATQKISEIHDRMPVILDPAAYDEWLDTDIKGNDAKALLRSQNLNDNLEFHRVGRGVNSSRYDGTDTKKTIVNSQ